MYYDFSDYPRWMQAHMAQQDADAMVLGKHLYECYTDAQVQLLWILDLISYSVYYFYMDCHGAWEVEDRG